MLFENLFRVQLVWHSTAPTDPRVDLLATYRQSPTSVLDSAIPTYMRDAKKTSIVPRFVTRAHHFGIYGLHFGYEKRPKGNLEERVAYLRSLVGEIHDPPLGNLYL